MAVKTFCDVCGESFVPTKMNVVRRHLTVNNNQDSSEITIEVAVLVSLDCSWGSGDICEKCVIKTVVEGSTIASGLHIPCNGGAI